MSSTSTATKSLALLLVVAAIPFATAACDLLKKNEADAAPPAATTQPVVSAAPTPTVAPEAPVTAAPLHPAGHPGPTHVVKLADGGSVVVNEAGAPVPGFPGFPTALPSGFPTALPSGFPTALPSGFPTALPSGFPTAIPGFPLPDAGKK